MKRLVVVLVGLTLLTGCKSGFENDMEHIKRNQDRIEECHAAGGEVHYDSMDRVRCRVPQLIEES